VTFLYFLAFFVMAAGMLILFQVSPLQLISDFSQIFSRRKVKMKKQIELSINPKKLRGIRLIIKDARDVLRITNRSDRFNTLCMLSLILFVIGALLAGSMSNLIIMPVLAVGFALLPFLYVLFSASKFKKDLNGELETALSIITTAYMRSENFILAVQENLDYLNSPVKEMFEKFLTQACMINADIPQLLEEMKDGIDNSVFQEWCEAMILCQNDRNLKSTLTPIVGKLSDMRIVAGELDYLMYEPMKEIITMAVLLVANIPLIRSQSVDWYHTLMYSVPGQITLTISALVLFLSLTAVIRNTRPIEYKR
jgi:hypothetical protein